MAGSLKAIIAGAGFGGLTAAAGLARRGWSVTVFERQPEVRAAGSGIYIWENGLRVLDAIGARVVRDDTFRGLAMEQRDGDNTIIDPGELAPDVRLVTVPRKDLLEGVWAAATQAGVVIQTGAEVIGATAHGEFQFAGGRVESADLAIGSDGVWSAVRRALGLELFHEQTIEGALRAIIPGTQEDLGASGRDKYIENWNGTRRFLITPLSASEMYLAFTCPADDEPGKRSPLDHESWSRSFPHWAHLIRRVDAVLAWGQYSTISVRSWSAGRTAILGDAAHAQPPNLGQGGGMAMQVGLALAAAMEGVTDRRDIPERLAEWERRERGLVDHCQKWSRLYGEVSFLPDEIRRSAITRLMADSWVRTQLMKAARSHPTGT
jgi:2-polyprenyl-6-methoxyphenol hydroxylase-like FAD-dependent oxidoreductase